MLVKLSRPLKSIEPASNAFLWSPIACDSVVVMLVCEPLRKNSMLFIEEARGMWAWGGCEGGGCVVKGGRGKEG